MNLWIHARHIAAEELTVVRSGGAAWLWRAVVRCLVRLLRRRHAAVRWRKGFSGHALRAKSREQAREGRNGDVRKKGTRGAYLYARPLRACSDLIAHVRNGDPDFMRTIAPSAGQRLQFATATSWVME